MLAPYARPPLSIETAVVYDIETLPNCFCLNVVSLYGDDLDLTFEISQFKDDRVQLLAWFEHWSVNHTIMIGFNSIGFDYPVLHQIWKNPRISVGEIYAFAMSIIAGESGRFGSVVWESERFAPQLDLYKVMHFDNRAKSTSLKALEVNMRSETVMEMPVAFGVPLSRHQIDTLLIPYNKHDVKETKKFALISMDAIKFRLDLMNSGQVRGDVLNFSDTKIGGKILEQRLGHNVCYDEYGAPRQTSRSHINLNDIILPYIRFDQPAFRAVLDWMRGQTLSVDELTETIKTKGVFTGVKATVQNGNGELFDFDFGTGGIHGSVSNRRYVATDEWEIYDIDVTGLYPSIAIVNRFYPEHLGERFIEEYAKLPVERSKFKKGTAQNLAYKLAANGTYGNSNNQYSVFYDPAFTMSITINGQLLLCMLAEWLLSVSTLSIWQANTDGITYIVHKDRAEHANVLRRIWQRVTGLQLEEARYSRMWTRDCNNYIAEDLKGKLKKKGAYWFPDQFPEDIANAACWHKDLSSLVVIKAAVANMVNGTDIGRFVRGHADPFDFMLRAKVDRSSKLYIGDAEQQRVTRYYIASNGQPMFKRSPPKGVQGEYKRASKVSEYLYQTVINEIGPGVWDSRVHTKNRSKYDERVMAIEAGSLVRECNVASRFDFESVDFDWYCDQATKLVIPV